MIRSTASEVIRFHMPSAALVDSGHAAFTGTRGGTPLAENGTVMGEFEASHNDRNLSGGRTSSDGSSQYGYGWAQQDESVSGTVILLALIRI